MAGAIGAVQTLQKDWKDTHQSRQVAYNKSFVPPNIYILHFEKLLFSIPQHP